MVKTVKVEKVQNSSGFYSPNIWYGTGYAGIPIKFRNKINVGDTVTIYSEEDLNYGGFGAIVVKIPKESICDEDK